MLLRLTGERTSLYSTLISLGIGPDGHTASLFPGTLASQSPDVREKIRLAVSVEQDHVTYSRISLTLPVINNAANVIFVVTGERKAAMVNRVIRERDVGLPAARVEPSDGTLLLFSTRKRHRLCRKRIMCRYKEDVHADRNGGTRTDGDEYGDTVDKRRA